VENLYREVFKRHETKKYAIPRVILIALAACLASFAQSISGDLSGTVYDASGAIVPNASVVVKNDATGVESSTTSSATGEYHVSNLPAGRIRLR